MQDSHTLLTGKFIDLRALEESDAELTLSWRNSERARYLNAGAQSVDQQRKWISARPKNEYNYIIQLKNGQSVGMLSLVDVDRFHLRAETGRFLIGDEESVRGIPAAVEAMSLLYDLAFNRLNLQRLYGTIPVHNTRMIKWQKFLGMKDEGRLRSHFVDKNGPHDAVTLGILRDEYLEVFTPRAKALMSVTQA